MKNRAFTMLSLVITIIIMSIMIAAFFKHHSSVKGGRAGKIDRAKQQAANLTMNAIKMGLETFNSTNGRYPTTKEGIASLETLIRMPVFNDPWGHSFHYECPGKHNKSSYDLASYGKDGKPGGVGEDKDITNY